MNRRTTTTVIAWAALATAAGGLGCETAFQRIDRRTHELIAQTNAELGAETRDPRLSWAPGVEPASNRGAYLYDGSPPTTNPSARALSFTSADDVESVNARLEQYAAPPTDAISLDLRAALQYAVQNSREYQFEEENYVLDALRLLSERHLWSPRLFNDSTVELIDRGFEGFHETSLRLVNETTVTQRLPFGGEVAATLLAQASYGLHETIATEDVQSLDMLFSLDIPLLRGAGLVAQEDLIQSERNVVYAARRFERFRRQFLVDITSNFLDLVIQRQAIDNSVANVELLEKFEAREVALTRSGRQPPFQAAQAAQTTLFARDRLNNQRELYRLALDRFKVRIGMPDAQPVLIVPSSPSLPTPRVELDQAVWAAMHYRLDLQNLRDQIDDSRRGVNNARNELLAELGISASAVPTVLNAGRGPDIDFNDTTFTAALVLGLPIDRTIERLALRQSQVDLERSLRGYEEFRDTVAVNVRSAVRDIDRAIFSRRLQAENVRIAELRVASIEAAPDRASALDRSEAATDLVAAQDEYLLALRDEQVAILNYLLASGQLRVTDDGSLRGLSGMTLRASDPLGARGLEAPAADGVMPEMGDPLSKRMSEAEQAEQAEQAPPPQAGPEPPSPAPGNPEPRDDDQDRPRPPAAPLPVDDVRK